MTEVAMKDIEESIKPKGKTTAPKKVKMQPLNNPPPKITRHEQIEDKLGYFYGVIPEELKGGLKSLLYYGMALPAPKHKRKRMLINLYQSKFTDQYISKYLHIDMLSILDDHSKMALVYGMNYLDAWMSSDVMEPMEQQKQTEQKSQPPKNDENII